MRCVVVLALLGACGDKAPVPADADVGLVRVTAYGRCRVQSIPPGVLAAGVEIRSYDATADSNHGHNTFATSVTDADGVAMLRVPAGGYVFYQPCSAIYELIAGVEPGDDLIVGDPDPLPTACSTTTGMMTVVFPTVANATSYVVNGFVYSSPTVVIHGCDGAQVSVLGEAYDSTMQLVGYQLQTVPFVDQSTLQLGALLAPAVLDLTVNPPLSVTPGLRESASSDGATVATAAGTLQSGGAYRFAYAKIAPTCTVSWDAPQGADPAPVITISTDRTSLAVDVPLLSQSPATATRFIGAITNAAPTGDLQTYAQYLIDMPPGGQSSPPNLPIELPSPSPLQVPVNSFQAYAIRDSQYDDYADFRNQRRHLDRELQRSVVSTASKGVLYSCYESQCWQTAR